MSQRDINNPEVRKDIEAEFLKSPEETPEERKRREAQMAADYAEMETNLTQDRDQDQDLAPEGRSWLDDQEEVDAIIQEAQKNQQQSIEMPEGTPRFQQFLYVDATINGIEIKGYEPTEEDIDLLERKNQRLEEERKDKEEELAIQAYKKTWFKEQEAQLSDDLGTKFNEEHKQAIYDLSGPGRTPPEQENPYDDLRRFTSARDVLKEALLQDTYWTDQDVNEANAKAQAYDDIVNSKETRAEKYLQQAYGVSLEEARANEKGHTLNEGQTNSIRHVKEKDLHSPEQPEKEEPEKEEKKKRERKWYNPATWVQSHEPAPAVNTMQGREPFAAHQAEAKEAAYKNINYKDLGDKLEVPKSVPGEESGQKLAQVAKENGWKTIEVDGTADFKQAAWREATAQGLEVKGYKPNEQDLKAVEARKAELTTEAVKNKPNSIQHLAHEKIFKELIQELPPDKQQQALQYFNREYVERSQYKEPAQIAMTVPVQEQAKTAERDKTTSQERDR